MLHYRLFSVPVNAPQDEMRELNKFLSGHRIMQVDKTLATDGGSSFYVFCIAYDEKNPQHSASSRNAVDYKEVLNMVFMVPLVFFMLKTV